MSELLTSLSTSGGNLNNDERFDLDHKITIFVKWELEQTCSDPKDAQSVVRAVKALCLKVLDAKVHPSHHPTIWYAISGTINGWYDRSQIREVYKTLPHCNGVWNPLIWCMLWECFYGPFVQKNASPEDKCNQKFDWCRVSTQTIETLAKLDI